MKKAICLLFVVLTFLSCSANTNLTVDEPKEENNPPKEIADINPGDVSDMSLYPSKPYFEEGAGYRGIELEGLSSDRIKTFTAGGNDSERLNNLIDELNEKGGGKILIQKGDYLFKDIYLKSNIHITIEAGTTIAMDHNRWYKGIKNFLFNVGMVEGKPVVENARVVGLGDVHTRPRIILEKLQEKSYRAIAIGYVKDVLVENFTVDDDLTKGSAVAFNPVKVDDDNAHIAENVTIANISLTGGSIGYGLAQTNVGKNILLKNLSSQGGMTCRIEAHTGRQYDLGVSNIVIKNVASINGKAAVLLQPHSVLNGRVYVDGAKSEGSAWTLFLREGFVAKDSKRRAKGSFSQDSTFKNISLKSTDNNATLSYKNFKYVPSELHHFYKTPEFNPVLNDANYALTDSGDLTNESAIVGSSVAVIFTDASYPMSLPTEEEIVLLGKTENRPKVIEK
ncbi:hypothetical protein [Wenyingzhuangia sp. IMCC45574]